MSAKTTIVPEIPFISLREIDAGGTFRWANPDDTAHGDVSIVLKTGDVWEMCNLTNGWTYNRTYYEVTLGRVHRVEITEIKARIL